MLTEHLQVFEVDRISVYISYFIDFAFFGNLLRTVSGLVDYDVRSLHSMFQQGSRLYFTRNTSLIGITEGAQDYQSKTRITAVSSCVDWMGTPPSFPQKRVTPQPVLSKPEPGSSR